MLWTDKIRQVKIALVAVAVAIAVASLVASHYLVGDLRREEEHKMEVWAEAMRALNTADENTDLSLVLRVIDENNTIPVIVYGGQESFSASHDNNAVDSRPLCRNVRLRATTAADSLGELRSLAREWAAEGHAISIDIGHGERCEVTYGESLLIKRLRTYPYVQLGVVLLFVVVAIFALLTSKRAEQNKVWVGLSKETAHQLGTPISSLMAWAEMLRQAYPDDTLLPEMERDIGRLRLIADRFSKIGSRPELALTPLAPVLEHVAEYMGRRTSRHVVTERRFPQEAISAPLCAPLFEWVVENLCKNAVDAMDGEGRITLTLTRAARHAIIDVEDTGKGIRRRDIRSVFRPGFTTKRRGWGLGLSLARRIVEEYHGGRIFVLRSEPGQGTTFRITLPGVVANCQAGNQK